MLLLKKTLETTLRRNVEELLKKQIHKVEDLVVLDKEVLDKEARLSEVLNVEV